MVFVKRHDESKHGILWADGDTELASLADLVRWVQQSGRAVPLVDAATRVIETLRAEGDALALFTTDPMGFAKAAELRFKTQSARPALMAGVVPAPRRGSFGGSQERKLVYQQARAAQEEKFESQLDRLQRVWVKHATDPKVFDQLPYVRLAMPMQRAIELFKCGPELSFWEAPALPSVPAMPLQPGHYPPRGLEGLRPHGAEAVKALGVLLTDEAPPRGLVRLADLVHLQRDRDRMPAVRRAAASVLRTIKDHPMPALFLLQRGDLARAVGEDDPWCDPYPSGVEHEASWREGLNSGFLGAPNCLTLDEAHARGLPVTAEENKRGFVALEPDQFLKLQALPELRGTAGALSWLARCWTERANSFDDLDSGPHAGLAMLQVDAVRMFGRVQPATPDAAPVAGPVVLALAGVAGHPEPPVEVDAPAPVVPWEQDELQTLVNANAEECKQGARGAAGRVRRRWSSLFPGRALVSVQRIKKLLEQAETAGIEPEQQAGWASMVLPAGSRPALKFGPATGPRKAG